MDNGSPRLSRIWIDLASFPCSCWCLFPHWRPFTPVIFWKHVLLAQGANSPDEILQLAENARSGSRPIRCHVHVYYIKSSIVLSLSYSFLCCVFIVIWCTSVVMISWFYGPHKVGTDLLLFEQISSLIALPTNHFVQEQRRQTRWPSCSKSGFDVPRTGKVPHF